MSIDNEKTYKSQRQYQEALAEKLGYLPHAEAVRALWTLLVLHSALGIDSAGRLGAASSDRQSALWGMRTGEEGTATD